MKRRWGGVLFDEGREAVRRAALLGLGGAGVLYAGAWGAHHGLGPNGFAPLRGGVFVFSLGSMLFFLRRSSLSRRVAHALMGTWTVGLGFALFFGGGFHETVLAGYFLSLVVPVFLLGAEGLIWSGSAAFLAGIALALEAAGALPSGPPAVVGVATPFGAFSWALASGVMAAVLGFYEHVRAESASQLRNSEAQLREIIDQSREAVGVLVGGRWRFVNARFASLIGCEVEKIQEAPAASFVLPEDRATWEALRPKDAPVLLRWMTTGGGVRWVDATLVPTRWDGVEAMMCFFLDRTEALAAERALADKQAELLQAQKMDSLGRLAGGVAHDFNNHLTTILGFAELARDAVHRSNPMREDLDQVVLAANRASALTRQLLAISRMQPVEKLVVQFDPIVLEMSRMLRRLIGEHIGLEINLQAAKTAVDGDIGQLEQVRV